jgi:hypothetical protein
MEWVASTLHTTSEHGVSSITTADAHTSAASSRLNSSVSPKDEIWFLRVCHQVSNELYNPLSSGDRNNASGIWPTEEGTKKLVTTYGCIYSSELLMMGNDGPKLVENF